jgi:hypothetical protein
MNQCRQIIQQVSTGQFVFLFRVFVASRLRQCRSSAQIRSVRREAARSARARVTIEM